MIADVNRPVVGINILAYFGLLVDSPRRSLIDEVTQLISSDISAIGEMSSIKTIDGNSEYH